MGSPQTMPQNAGVILCLVASLETQSTVRIQPSTQSHQHTAGTIARPPPVPRPSQPCGSWRGQPAALSACTAVADATDTATTAAR